jgi:glycogen debranching enzyme
MISLPGLCLVTGRFDDAKKNLRVFAQSISQGMWPNRFPDVGTQPEYNAVDATMWFFVAIYKYLQYTGDETFVRDSAYHQRTVWSWLLGPLISAVVRVEGPAGRKRAKKMLKNIIPHLSDAGIGTISEIFDAEPPHAPCGCIAQAWGVAEVLRAYVEATVDETPKMKTPAPMKTVVT